MSWQRSDSIATKAPREAVWRVLSDPGRWHTEWDPDCESASLDGPFAEGTNMKLKMKGSPKRTMLLCDVVEGERFTGEDRMPLTRMTFRHELADADGGGTRVTITQTISGPLSPLVARLLGPRLERSVTERLAGIDRVARESSAAPAS